MTTSTTTTCVIPPPPYLSSLLSSYEGVAPPPDLPPSSSSSASTTSPVAKSLLSSPLTSSPSPPCRGWLAGLHGASFPSREMLSSFVRELNYKTGVSSMREHPGGSRRIILKCFCSRCTITFTGHFRKGRWWLSIRGEHISCTPCRGLQLPLTIVARSAAVSALLSQFRPYQKGGFVSVKALQGAATSGGIPISPSNTTRLKHTVAKSLQALGEKECRALGYYCEQVCVLNKGAKTFLRCYNTQTMAVVELNCSSDPVTGALTVTGSLAGSGASRDTLNLLSLYHIPPHAVKLFELACSTSSADFARMIHVTNVYSNVMAFLWNVELGGASHGLMFGQYLGFEDGEMWSYSRAVRLHNSHAFLFGSI